MFSGRIRIAIAVVMAELLTISALAATIFYVISAQPVTQGQWERLAQELANWVVPVAAFTSCALAGWWAARTLDSGQARRGQVVGILVAVLDVALLVLLGASGHFVLVLAVASRFVGGELGGMYARHRKERSLAKAPAVP